MNFTTEDSSMRVNEGVERHDFGVTDSKGRAVGCTVSFQVKTYVEDTPAHKGPLYRFEAGTYYCWMGQATRGGEMFGAGQNWNRCNTEAERFAQVEKYLKGAQARAIKQFA